MSRDLVFAILRSSPSLTALAELRSIKEQQIEAVQAYAQGGKCRRRTLLAYFGEEKEPGPCGNCDRCLGGRESGGKSGLPPGVWRGLGLFGKGTTD
jgi:superfamily II DNA helicase RecQ